jgi:SAM-dependent methyltransferase
MSTEDRRARFPPAAAPVLDGRLTPGNPGLEPLLAPGMRVLDVGCGSGTIARQVARAVGPAGAVVGVDVSAELVMRAVTSHLDVANLRFEVRDVRTGVPRGPWDLAYAARALQWLVRPQAVVDAMAIAVVPGGQVQLYDYDHEVASWTPGLPASMERLYCALLEWRADAGMDNRIGRRLGEMLARAGLTGVQTRLMPLEARRDRPASWREAVMWADLAATRAHQLVQGGYLSEIERAEAEADYRSWLCLPAATVRLTLFSSSGRRWMR